MSSVDQTSIDQNELEKRLMEIQNQIQNLVEKKEAIEIMLQENFPSKRFHSDNNDIIKTNEQNKTSSNSQSSNNANSNSTNTNQQNITNPNPQIINNPNNEITNINQQNNTESNPQCSSNKDKSQSLEQEEKRSESKNSVNNNLDSIKNEKNLLYDRELKKFDKAKQFFEENWNGDGIFQFKIPECEGLITERQIMAYRKMFFFIQGHYMNHYENEIKQASLKQEDYELPPDQLKAAFENLLHAMIMRSKVLELFDKCGIEAGKLYKYSDAISQLQVYSYNTPNLQYVIFSLLENQEFFTWNFEKLKALFELWQGCVIGGSFEDDDFRENSDYFFDVYNCFLILNVKYLELTEQQKSTLESILKAAKDFCF